MSAHAEHLERRRAERFALQLPASVRERAGTRIPVRVIDISTHGCRIESRSSFPADARVWIYLANLAAVDSRVAWCRDNFAGLEFSSPLYEAVLDGILGVSRKLEGSDLAQLEDISRRSRWLADKASHPSTAEELARLSRDCAASVIAGKLSGADKPPQP